MNQQQQFQTQIENLDDCKFMMDHFECISTRKQIENGTYAFIVKRNFNLLNEDKVVVLYRSGYTWFDFQSQTW